MQQRNDFPCISVSMGIVLLHVSKKIDLLTVYILYTKKGVYKA